MRGWRNYVFSTRSGPAAPWMRNGMDPRVKPEDDGEVEAQGPTSESELSGYRQSERWRLAAIINPTPSSSGLTRGSIPLRLPFAATVPPPLYLLPLWEKVDRAKPETDEGYCGGCDGLLASRLRAASLATPHPPSLRSGTFSHKGRRRVGAGRSGSCQWIKLWGVFQRHDPCDPLQPIL